MRTFLILILSFVCLSINAQFVATPTGLRCSENQNNSYLVLTFEGISAHDLYAKSQKYVNENRKDAAASIKGNTVDEYLRFSTYAPSFIKYNNGPMTKIPINATYDIELRFKDGKVRFEFVDLKMNAGNYDLKFSGGILSGYVIYKNNGDLFKKEAKDDVERYFNSVVSSYVEFIKGTNKNEDW
jgi:hypothetical protein